MRNPWIHNWRGRTSKKHCCEFGYGDDDDESGFVLNPKNLR
jgi:hypothetical protein